MGMAVQVRRFTVDEYHRMAEAGILTEDDRVELLDGEIVVLTPLGRLHAAAVARVEDAFHRAQGGRAIEWVQNPIVLGVDGEPQPDLCLLQPRADFYAGALPGPDDVLLVVEVADTSVRRDRERKIPSCGRAGISEAWLMNLRDAVIEVYRNPAGGRYRDVRTARRGETVAPLAFPDVTLQVEEILGEVGRPRGRLRRTV